MALRAGVMWVFGVFGAGCVTRTFEVTFDESAREEAATGRLVVYLSSEGEPGYSLDHPQPMYGVDVVDVEPGEVMTVGRGATSFPAALRNLDSGRYLARAVLDVSSEHSDWEREAGNLWSETIKIELGPHSSTHRIELTQVVEERVFAESERVRLVEVQSELLSAFRGERVMLRAGVVLPEGYEGGRAYPALYVVPGFGGDHFGAVDWLDRGGAWGELLREVVVVVLDPEGPNGHTLFADSANNGPVGEALVTELIPEIERTFGLIAEPGARLLRGHSSGGWSVIWLAIMYPEVFGAAWSSAPDPVDFRAFQDIDLYEDLSAYVRETIVVDRWTREIEYYDADYIPSMREGGRVVLLVRDENAMEEVLGPDNTSAQQWDSWFAVFGPRGENGHPVGPWIHPWGRMLYRVVEAYEAYDIGLIVERDWPRTAEILSERVRILVGDADDFYLDQAVAMLAARVSRLEREADDQGWIEIVPGATHGSILDTEQAGRMPVEMLNHLRRHGHLTGQEKRR